MSSPRSPRLTKSKFLSGLQCQKRLYLEVHAPSLATQPDQHTRALLDTGTAIGVLARERYPGGALVDMGYRRLPEALRRTAELVSDPSIPAIFEGAFEFNHVLIRVDILERVSSPSGGEGAWRVVEVKSSTRVKDVHLEDLTIQSYVLKGIGLEVVSSMLMHINTQYVYSGAGLELEKLFAVQDMTEAVTAKQVGIPDRLEEMKVMLASPSQPRVEPDQHCHKPYACQFWEHCTKDKPARWVYHLPGGRGVVQDLMSRGVETIDDIPHEVHLTSVQGRMKRNVEWTSPQLQRRLGTVRYPVHHLDFETFMPAIPQLPLTRPYQAIPTQWSNHIESEDGSVCQDEYLCTEVKDPREELALALLESVGTQGSICVYSAYERAILEHLVESLPRLRKELLGVIDRLWDLFPVIRDHYYHPLFQGSYSMKSVLPALVPELSYGDLEIQDGRAAASLYQRMVFHETDWVEKARIREALLRYCERDTLAMVEIRRVLRTKALSR